MLDEITKALADTLAREVIRDEAGYDLRRTAGAGEGVWWAANVQGYVAGHEQTLGFKPSAPEVLLAAAQVAAYFERHAGEIRAAAAVLRASDLHRLSAAQRAGAWLARYGERELLGSLSPDAHRDILVMRERRWSDDAKSQNR